MLRRGPHRLVGAIALAVLLVACTTSPHGPSPTASTTQDATTAYPARTDISLSATSPVRPKVSATTASTTAFSIPTLSGGTYSQPIYQLCGQDFFGFIYNFPDLPNRLPDGFTGVEIVLTDQCAKGGSVKVVPAGAVTIKVLVMAADKRPVVVGVIPRPGTPATVTLTPPTGPAKTIRFTASG